MRIRIKFAKSGVMKFIGHLDVMRYFQKALRRAGVEVSYTGGFSPHQIMSFAAPLGVGICSNGEYMDIEVDSHQGGADMLERLNNVMVPGMKVLEVKALPDNAGNAMASVAAARYTILCTEAAELDFDLSATITALMEKERIPFIKETKKSTLEIDLKPGIYELTAEQNSLSLMVDASSEGNIKPLMVMQCLYRQAGKEFPASPVAFSITREDTYTNIGTKEMPKFVPLGAVGEDF